MNVWYLQFNFFNRFGGIEQHSRRMLRCLSELSSPDQPATAFSLWDEPRSVAGIHFVACNRSKLLFLRRFFGELRASPPDLLWVGNILFMPLVLLVRLFSKRTKILLMVYGIDAWSMVNRFLYLWIWLAIRFCADGIVSISAYTVKHMKKLYSLKHCKVFMLPCAVDVAPRDSVAFRHPARRGKNRLLSVARLSLQDRYKGCDLVLRALPHILQKFPDTTYSIVGDGDLRSELESLTSRLGLQQHVCFHGAVSDETLAQLYEAGTVFVLPSQGEGFGIVFLEAWSHGLPVICGNIDASPEVVSHGQDGLTVNPSDEAELAQAILSLLSNPEWAVALGEAGCRKVHEKYTHAHFHERMARIIKATTERYAE